MTANSPPAIGQVSVSVSGWHPWVAEKLHESQLVSSTFFSIQTSVQIGSSHASANGTRAIDSTATSPNWNTTTTPTATPSASPVCRPIEASPNPIAAAARMADFSARNCQELSRGEGFCPHG